MQTVSAGVCGCKGSGGSERTDIRELHTCLYVKRQLRREWYLTVYRFTNENVSIYRSRTTYMDYAVISKVYSLQDYTRESQIIFGADTDLLWRDADNL